MARSIDGVIEWAKANPLYTYKDGTGRKKSWAGLCEAFVNNAGDFDESFGSALIAGNNSGPLNGEWAKAPRGAIHYWAGVGGDGHVAFELGGGTLLMASSRTSNYGTALGTIHFLDYGLPLYRGWTMRHGTETLTGGSSLAGSNNTTLENRMAFDAAEKLTIDQMGQSVKDFMKETIDMAGQSIKDDVIAEVSGIPKDVWGFDLIVNLPATKTSPAREVKGHAQTWFLNMSNAIGQQNGQIAGLTAALQAVGAGKSIDIDAIVAATKSAAIAGAQEGAGRAFDNLTVTLSTEK